VKLGQREEKEDKDGAKKKKEGRGKRREKNQFIIFLYASIKVQLPLK
jgi:hypothetical protein